MRTFTVVAEPNGAGKSTLTRMARRSFRRWWSWTRTPLQRSNAPPEGLVRQSMPDVPYLAWLKSFSMHGKASCRNDTLRKHLLADDESCAYRRIFERLLYVGTVDVSINVQRVCKRVSEGGHDIPEEDQLRRYPRSLANFKKAFALADEAVVLDNSTSKGHVRVAEKSKQGVIFYSAVPAWASFLEKYR